ncbi:MAG: hypothetical protein K0Q71_5042 [Thermomicrobiales bacterium]|jgi:hypothetical protein|nr:hypothetical protein [Thermomicrobiales bacterium]
MGSPEHWRLERWEDCVLSAAAAIGGDVASDVWFEVPIPDLDGLSPRELLLLDRAAEVFDYLSTLELSPPAITNWNASER